MERNPATDLEFSYRVPGGTILLGCCFFGPGGAFMVHKALTNQKGLNISGIITLGPQGASIFYWVWACIFFLFVAACIYMAVILSRGGQRVAITERGLIIPRHRYSRQERLISYDTITGISIFSFNKHEFLRVQWHGGKFDFTVSMFESRDTALALMAALEDRCAGPAKSGPT